MLKEITLVISSLLSFMILSLIPICLIYGFIYTYSGWSDLFRIDFQSQFKLKTTILTTFIYILMLYLTFTQLIHVHIETNDFENDGEDDLKNNTI